MPMQFSRRWDFDQGNKMITLNDLRDDDEVQDALVDVVEDLIGDGEVDVGGISFSVDSSYVGLRIRFGPNPIPHPAAFENGIYVVLPDRD